MPPVSTQHELSPTCPPPAGLRAVQRARSPGVGSGLLGLQASSDMQSDDALKYAGSGECQFICEYPCMHISDSNSLSTGRSVLPSHRS